MEIKLEDYIHFYIGCEIIDVTKAQGTLSGTHGEYGPEVAYGTSEEPEYPGIENIKLILRKLSDMTEEDRLKYGWTIEETDEGLKVNYPFESFRLLCKDGWDLFGLIPAGLAIDKTSLKN